MMRDMKRYNVRDRCLKCLCRDRLTTYVFLMNGVRLRGQIVGFDQETLALSDPQRGGKVQIVFLRAVTTISPLEDVDIFSRREYDDLPAREGVPLEGDHDNLPAREGVPLEGDHENLPAREEAPLEEDHDDRHYD